MKINIFRLFLTYLKKNATDPKLFMLLHDSNWTEFPQDICPNLSLFQVICPKLPKNLQSILLSFQKYMYEICTYIAGFNLLLSQISYEITVQNCKCDFNPV